MQACAGAARPTEAASAEQEAREPPQPREPSACPRPVFVVLFICLSGVTDGVSVVWVEVSR